MTARPARLGIIDIAEAERRRGQALGADLLNVLGDRRSSDYAASAL